MNSNEVQQKWVRAEDIAPKDLAEARIQLHHALQLVADAGRKLGPDGHTEVPPPPPLAEPGPNPAPAGDTEFLLPAQGLATGEARGDGPFRVALGVADFA